MGEQANGGSTYMFKYDLRQRITVADCKPFLAGVENYNFVFPPKVGINDTTSNTNVVARGDTCAGAYMYV